MLTPVPKREAGQQVPGQACGQRGVSSSLERASAELGRTCAKGPPVHNCQRTHQRWTEIAKKPEIKRTIRLQQSTEILHVYSGVCGNNGCL